MKSLRKRFYVFIISTIILVSALQTQLVFGQSETLFNMTRGEISKIEVDSDSGLILNLRMTDGKYLVNQIAVVTGNIYDNNGKPISAKISLEVTYYKNDTSKPSTVYKSSVFSTLGKFRDAGLNLEKEGSYTVNAITVVNDTRETASIAFEVVGLHETTAGWTIFVGLGAVVALLLFMAFIPITLIKLTHVGVLRFGLVTLILVAVILFFIYSDVQIGQSAPLGLVAKQTTRTLEDLTLKEISVDEIAQFLAVDKFEWVINVGGDVRDNYSSGIQIPVFVFIFGMLGGYLRFLQVTAKKWLRDALKSALLQKYNEEETAKKIPGILHDAYEKGIFDESLTRVLFNRSMKDLALLIVSPLLAVAIYFILVQAGIDDANDFPTIAAVSFGVGLVTDTAIKRLQDFVGGTLGSIKDRDKKPKERTTQKE